MYKGIIYKITNLVNGKIYIGKTIQGIQKRWYGHLKKAKIGKGHYLHSAIRKYGAHNFKIEQVCECNSAKELNQKEQYWISYYNSDNHSLGYNLTPGGEINPMETKEVKARHDSIMKSLEVRSKISKTMKKKITEGKMFSSEHRRKISQSSRNRVWIHKDDIYTHVKKDVVEEYIKNGWEYGGKPIPEEAIKRAAEKKFKKVKCINEHNELIKEFNSIKEAAIWWYNNGWPNKSEALDRYPYALSDIIKKSYKQDKFINGLKWIYEERKVVPNEKVNSN